MIPDLSISPRTTVYALPTNPHSFQNKDPNHDKMLVNTAISPSQSPSSSIHPSAAASAFAQTHPPTPFQSYHEQHGHPSTLNRPNDRRPSRFDPMGHDADGESYEDMGHRYPLRRVQEEEGEGLSLPSIKSLFGGEHPPTPTSSHPPFYTSGSLSSFSSSAGSPSSSRTSRYSSLASASSVESHPPSGWWAPDHSAPNPAVRSHSFPLQYSNEPDSKRRRSDLPISSVDPEEVARLKYQSQSRNASYPVANHAMQVRPPLSINGPISGAPSPPLEHGGAYLFNRRESSVPSRSPSFSGQLSRSFADLSASERGEMLPPMRSPQIQDRRPSMLRPPSLEDKPHSPSGLRASPVQPDRRSRPPSPDRTRSSLTEQIMAKSGDDVAMASGLYQSSPINPTGMLMAKQSLSEPLQPTWGRRDSSDSTISGAPMSLNSDNEGPPISIRRNRPQEVDVQADPMRGMDILAESAKRAAALNEESRDSEEREASPEENEGEVVPGPGPKYRCNFCAKTFSRPSSLRIHTYSHTGERPFVCKEPSCRRRFSVQSNLKRHAKVHQMSSGSGADTPPAPPLVHPPNHVFAYRPRPPGSDGYVFDHSKGQVHPPPYPQPSESEHMTAHYRDLQAGNKEMKKEEEWEDDAVDELEEEEET